jgi:hypothetical protein
MCLVEPNVTGSNQAKQQTGGVRAALLLRGLVVSFAVLVPPLVAYALLKPDVTMALAARTSISCASSGRPSNRSHRQPIRVGSGSKSRLRAAVLLRRAHH